MLSDLKALMEVRKYIVECKPDLINTHTAKAGLIGRLAVASILKDRPTIIHTYHGHLLYGYFPKWKSNVLIFIEKFLANFTDVLIAAGDKVKSDLLDAGIGREDQYIVARPGVKILDIGTKEQARIKAGLPSDEIIVGWLGRLAPIKRPDRVIELAKHIPGVNFIIAGDGELRAELEAMASRNVYFLGVQNSDEMFSLADVVILTSDSEGMPLTLIEGQMAGVPAIATDVGSVSEIVENEVTGLVTSTQIEQIISSLGRLLGDSMLRSTMAKAAGIRAKENFSVEKMVTSHIQSYQQVIG